MFEKKCLKELEFVIVEPAVAVAGNTGLNASGELLCYGTLCFFAIIIVVCSCFCNNCCCFLTSHQYTSMNTFLVCGCSSFYFKQNHPPRPSHFSGKGVSFGGGATFHEGAARMRGWRRKLKCFRSFA